jgi:hypothetical protein
MDRFSPSHPFVAAKKVTKACQGILSASRAHDVAGAAARHVACLPVASFGAAAARFDPRHSTLRV